MNKVKSIHFVGIKGVGLTPLAIIAKQAGIKVTGSDVAEEFITDQALKKAGITPLVDFLPEHLPKNLDLVITTGAHGGLDNPEVVAARERLIPVMTKGEAVGAFMQGDLLGRSFTQIAVAGSHGKTTSTAMLATVLQKAGFDPTYIIGTGSTSALDLPGHLGKGQYFVAESDEYATEPAHNHKAQFLWQYPDVLLLTNIEHDHPDIYPTLMDVEKVFREFATHISTKGFIVGCGDDELVYSLLKEHPGKTISFGFSPKNQYVLTRVHISGGQMFFRLQREGMDLEEFRLSVFGEHNALNAAGVVAVCMELGIPLEKIKEALPEFSGSKRRLEYKGQLTTGAYLFDDYAHHPTEIRNTLKSLRIRYPKSTLIAIFQPHTYSRTKALLPEFVTAFDDANDVIIMDIFSSAREKKDPTITSGLLAQQLAVRHPAVLYLPTIEDVAALLSKENLKDNTVIVFMGAGDIYKTIDLLPKI
ncbi:MAG TPA: UDP-N-acetylmuramate--L-alanine ligase [Patescibacteria group bacterium]|nr:UDP-N-acetylmuramate--L-alanine ligase [Patescibacteria group bacterium]